MTWEQIAQKLASIETQCIYFGEWETSPSYSRERASISYMGVNDPNDPPDGHQIRFDYINKIVEQMKEIQPDSEMWIEAEGYY